MVDQDSVILYRAGLIFSDILKNEISINLISIQYSLDPLGYGGVLSNLFDQKPSLE